MSDPYIPSEDLADIPEDRSSQASSIRGWSRWLAAIAAAYWIAAYLVIPWLWKAYEHRHPLTDTDPRITTTSDGHPGDPLNVGIIGSDEDLKRVMRAAGWFQADRLGLRADLAIGADTVLSREYDQAPVSDLFLFGRKEDFAFEQPVGNNPRHRHHVRFWKNATVGDDGRAIWLGSASYDQGVGLSHTTGQVTHHISAMVDQERDHVALTLSQGGGLAEAYRIPAYHRELSGKNGGGDPWRTDGDLWMGVTKSAP